MSSLDPTAVAATMPFAVHNGVEDVVDDEGRLLITTTQMQAVLQ